LTGIVGWVQGNSVPWPASVVQDSVAAIVRQRVYQRSVRATLFERLLDWLSALIRRLFSAVSEIPHAKWIILGLAILVVLAIAARIWLGSEAEERRSRLRSSVVQGGADPWIEADRLAAAGRYTDAAQLLYRGVTERLAAEELIRLHASKTSGDYARELRGRGSDIDGEFRQFGRRYDHVLFGTGTCDAATYAALREHARRVTRPEARAA
jgi:hypothetical protein